MKIKHIALFVLTLFSVIHAKTYQVEITPNVWQLIGVNGFHKDSASQVGFISNGSYATLKDTNDSADLMTYDRNSSNAINTINTPDTGDVTLSTLGIKIFNGVYPQLTDLRINYEYHIKDEDLSLYTMYLTSAGTNAKPNIKIEYQSDYEGSPFYISTGDGNTYVGTFSSASTYDKPQLLTLNTIKSYTKITEIFDMNISDNDLNNLDNFDPSGVEMTKLNNYPDANLTIYAWDSSGQQWNFYRSGSGFGDFTELEAGRAYWVKLDISEDVKPGMILGEGEILGGTTYQDKTDRRWNLLSFNDSYLVDNASALFIDHSAFQDSGIAIRRGVFVNDIIRVPVEICDSDINVSAFINNALSLSDRNGTSHWNLRAYPATYPASGVVVVSDENIDVNATTATLGLYKSIGDDTLTTSDYPSLTSETSDASYSMITTQQLNEYMFAIKVNQDLVLNLANDGLRKGKLEVRYVNGNTFYIDISAEATLEDIAAKIGTDMLANVPNSGNAGAVAVDMDFDGNSETIIIASTGRFSLKDATFVRTYQYLSKGTNSTAYVYSSNGFNAFTTVANDVVSTAANINAEEGGSGVSAYVIDGANNRLMLVSDSYREFNIIEGETDSQFNIITYDANESIYGAVREIYTIPQMAAGFIPVFDEGNTTLWTVDASDITAGTVSVGVPVSVAPLNDNLGYMAQQVDDYTVDSPAYELADLGLMIETIYGGTLFNEYVYWQSSDLTMDPSLYNNSDNFNLQKLNRNRGYWVYLANKSSNTISIDTMDYAGSIDHFMDNNFSYTKEAIGSVSNYFDETISLEIDGLDTTSSSVYRAEMIIDGKKNTLVRQGYSSTFISNLNSFETDGIEVREYPALNKTMQIRLYDGLNNRYTFDITNFNTTKPGVATVGHLVHPTTHVDYLTFVLNSGSVIKVFDGNISDYYGYQENNLLISSSTLSKYGTKYIYNPASSTDISFGTASKPYYDLRVIVANSDNLWSDMRRIFYAPVYKGTHILSDVDTNSTDYDSSPIAYSVSGDAPYKWVDGNGDPVDSGVQLRTDDTNSSVTTTLTMSYKPKNVTINTTIPYTAYLSDNNATDGQLGVITYASEYEGTVFYIYHKEDDKLYYGVFPGNGVNDSNTTMYILNEIDTDQTFTKPSL